MTRMLAASLLLFVTSRPAMAQVRDRTSGQTATGTAAITGTIVTDTQPPGPVRRASVSLTSSEPTGVAHTVITGDDGRFAFTALPPGRYSLVASKRGWVTSSFGAKAAGRAGRQISLADGQRATATIAMPRTAVITGVVLDQNGEPPAAAIVRAMRYSYSPTGERRLIAATHTSSGPDERGRYRIFNLNPGDYYVTASSVPQFGLAGRDLHLTSDVDVQEALKAVAAPAGPAVDVPQRSVGLAQTFYPGTASVAQAILVSVRAGEERSGIDFAVQYTPMARVSGTVTSAEVTLPPATQVNLINNDPTVTGLDALRTARTGADGKFEFAEVAPGGYTLVGRATLPPQAGGNGSPRLLTATTDLDVQSDLSGLSLALEDGFTISGAVTFAGTGPPPFAHLRIVFAPVQGGTAISLANTGANVDVAGHFVLNGVAPGRYRLTVQSTTPQITWAVRSATIGGQDALDTPLDIRQPSADAAVVITDGGTQLRGTVKSASGTAADAFVVLFSENRAHWIAPSRRILTGRTASDGSYTIDRLPAGDYRIVALDDLEPGQQYDPAFLERLLPVAEKVTIAEGEKKVQDVRLGGG